MRYVLTYTLGATGRRIFQYSVGDAPDLARACAALVRHDFQYSVGDASAISMVLLRLETRSNFQYSVGDAYGT